LQTAAKQLKRLVVARPGTHLMQESPLHLALRIGASRDIIDLLKEEGGRG
jgi:hypothetical protein